MYWFYEYSTIKLVSNPWKIISFNANDYKIYFEYITFTNYKSIPNKY